MTASNTPLFIALVSIWANTFVAADDAIEVVLMPTAETELAPHGKGNVYAPDILIEEGKYRMWYGGQGKDGHDRIHYAESTDGRNWTKHGIVFDDATANHVNDPSVIRVGDRYLMYYTVAGSGVTDRIDVAESQDGRIWKRLATALKPGEAHSWDSLLVGRPSVLFDEGQYKMWYDGRKDLPLGAPDKTAPKSANSHRSVGYATSTDGIHWMKQAEPVFEHDAGGIHVSRLQSIYRMVYETHEGTMITESSNGKTWSTPRKLVGRSGTPADAHGHVTPFLLNDAKHGDTLYVGAASAASWDRNCIARINLTKK